MTFDEQPDDPGPHGECAHEIHALQERIRALEAQQHARAKDAAPDDIHSCSYYCERPECIKRQRDEMREAWEAAKLGPDEIKEQP